MGKAASLCAVVLLVCAAVAPGRTVRVAQAQSAPLPCNAQPTVTPMQGHYTGPWHSDGDYHFVTMGYDVELKVTIDGTLDLTVSPDGQVTGTAVGKVDAPVYDSGRKDVSSGYGTISGSVTGVLTGGSLLVLAHPVIDMHWGTFVGGGYTVERFITMPDYTLSGGTGGCVSASGTIAEDGFPVQNIVDDANGQTTMVPGVGRATGTWQMASDGLALFTQLSGQVDAFISGANAVLAESPVRPSQVNAQVVQPLRSLENTIQAHPDVARCLLDRLGAWERSAVTALLARASTAPPTTLGQFRAQADLLRVTAAVNTDCALPDDGLSSSLQAAGLADLRKAAGQRDWSAAALLSRELLLWRGSSAEGQVESALSAGIHQSLQASTDGATLLDVARAAYVFADDADATAAYSRLTAKQQAHGKTAKKKKKKGSKKPAPRPTATAVPRPKTLEQVLAAGVAPIAGHAASDGTFTWPSVKGADRYVVTVYPLHGGLVWSWSGTATSARFGDTAVDGLVGSPDDGWSISPPSGFVWTVAALDSHGTVVGLKLR